jgi:tetratricopeptide (TPR) repeat protein
VTSRADLEVELADQLRSLDDLEAEYRAGDLDEDDYQTLRDGYTVRVADTMRQLDDQPVPTPASPPSGSRRRNLLLGVAAAVVFSVGAGVLLAQAAGERRLGETMTGSINTSRQRVLDCQELGAEAAIVEALQCFDELLIDDPDNAEALAWRGWYVVLTTSSAEAAGDAETASDLLEIGQTYLDRAVEADPSLPDARAFRAAVYDRRGESAAACAEVAALRALDPAPFYLNQTAAIAERNGC